MFKCRYFSIKELVSPQVYEKFNEFAWAFFDERVLRDLDKIRREWGSPIIINDWAYGGQYRESGLRCNVDSIVASKASPYLSGHVLAKAFDMKPKNGDVKELYNLVWDLMLSDKLKKLKRLEHIKHTPTWVHADGLRTQNNSPEVFTL